MLTARGWWLVTTALLLLGLSLWLGAASVAIVCLTILTWVLSAWVHFTVRVRLLHGKLHVEREVGEGRGPVDSLWAGRRFDVRVRLRCASRLPSPYLRVTDRVPFAARVVDGESAVDGAVGRGRVLEIGYSVECPAPGSARFEGVAVQIADLQGFFYHYLFVREPREYRVLPPLAGADRHLPAVKRRNTLPLLGMHRHRRPGTGSELLDLRDYLPGDPPRTIAWKVSARRDRLITKEFESEVPVRCTVFVDTSNSVRVGPSGRNALTRLIEIAGGVARANAMARDLPGLCLFDEQMVTYVRPARGRQHLAQLHGLLADAAALPATAGEAPVGKLLPLAAGLADEVYPELMRPDLNRVPAWMPWLWAVPSHRRRHRPSAAYPVTFALLAAVPLLAIGYGVWVLLRSVQAGVGGLFGEWPAALAVAAMVVAVLSMVASRAAGIYRALPQAFLSRRRRHVRWRKRLAALLSLRYGLAPGGLQLLMEDDRRFSAYVQRFLAEHQVPYDLPLYDPRGRYLFASPAKVEVLSRALLRAVGKGHDNELFVLMADLLELGERLGPLLSAVKVAAARHHQVVVVCPWPPGLPPPGPDSTAREATVLLGMLSGGAPPPDRLGAVLHRTSVLRFHRAYYRLRRAFARLGVPVALARGEESLKLIIERVERLRVQERGVR